MSGCSHAKTRLQKNEELCLFGVETISSRWQRTQTYNQDYDGPFVSPFIIILLKLSICDLGVLKTELFSVETKTAERETPVFPVYVTEKIVIDVSSVCIENFITFSLKRDGREQFAHN